LAAERSKVHIRLGLDLKTDNQLQILKSIGRCSCRLFHDGAAAQLARERFMPTRIHTEAKVKLEKVGDAFSITRINLATEAEVPGIDDNRFQKYASEAKQNCPLSKALAATEIDLTAKLV